MKNRVLEPNQSAILKDSEKYFKKICGFSQTLYEEDERMKEAFSVRERYLDQLKLKVIISINEEKAFHKEKLFHGKQRAHAQKILCTYAMCIDEMKYNEELDLLEQFYLDTWMTAMLDAGRDWLKQYLTEEICENSKNTLFVSDAFGPGFYGIGMEKLEEIYIKTRAEQIGMELFCGSLKPPKSNVGYYMISHEKEVFWARDCKHCLSKQKNCLFCKNYEQL